MDSTTQEAQHKTFSATMKNAYPLHGISAYGVPFHASHLWKLVVPVEFPAGMIYMGIFLSQVYHFKVHEKTGFFDHQSCF